MSAELADELDTGPPWACSPSWSCPCSTDGCIVTVVDRDGRPRDVGSWHSDPARRASWSGTPSSASTPSPRLPRRAGAAHGHPGDRVRGRRPPADATRARPGPARRARSATAEVLPLTAEGRTFGVLTLYLDAGRTLSGEDLDTARQVAAEAGTGRRPGAPAEPAGPAGRGSPAQPAHRTPAMAERADRGAYVPAAEAARVGGDWYDAFPQRDGTPVLVIGDVVGHDTAAAAVMGQLRRSCAASPITAAPVRPR